MMDLAESNEKICVRITLQMGISVPFLFLILTLLLGCSEQNDIQSISFAWQEICSRDEGDPLQRFPLYRAKVPCSWKRQDSNPKESNADTMQPICHFLITGGSENMLLSVHNFPSNSTHERIPPAAQITRWKQQFDQLNPSTTIVNPLSHGGFTGLGFEGTGIFHEKPTTVIGWSMQMAQEHYQNLQKNTFKNRQMRADYTLKIQGSPEAIRHHKNELLLFAHSFELIEEIPNR